MKLRHHMLVAILSGIAISASAERELTRIESLGGKLRVSLKRALDASFGFRLDPGIDCTGTFISDSGHFITALHCVAACLAKHDAVTREAALDEPVAYAVSGRSGQKRLRILHPYKVTVDDIHLKSNPTCEGRIAGKRVEIKLLATGGKGWLTPKNSLAAFSKRFPDEYKALLSDGYEHNADFAVLQVAGMKPLSCLPLVESRPSPKQNLQAISYPCVRRDGFQSSGETPLYTSGRRTNGFKESEYFKTLGSRRIEFDIESVDRDETFFSTLDIEKCGSGTALFDDRLNIVGIATRVYKLSTRYERGSLEAINSAHVLKELKSKRPADFKEMTTCSLKPLNPTARPQITDSNEIKSRRRVSDARSRRP